MRWQLACVAALVLCAGARAHFVYIIPASDGREVLAVFSDTLGPDRKVKIDKIAATKLSAIDADGKSSTLSWSKAEHALRAPLAASTSFITGITDYGVANSKHTGNIPVLILYHSKAVIGNLKPESSKLSVALEFEVVPHLKAGKLRFLATHKGKPAAKAACFVLVPGQDKGQRGITDENGYVPGQFEVSGRYGVWVRFVHDSPGEWKGKKYDRRHDYATLVVDHATSSR